MKKKVIIISIVSVVVLTLLAGGTGYYFYVANNKAIAEEEKKSKELKKQAELKKSEEAKRKAELEKKKKKKSEQSKESTESTTVETSQAPSEEISNAVTPSAPTGGTSTPPKDPPKKTEVVISYGYDNTYVDGFLVYWDNPSEIKSVNIYKKVDGVEEGVIATVAGADAGFVDVNVVSGKRYAYFLEVTRVNGTVEYAEVSEDIRP